MKIVLLITLITVSFISNSFSQYALIVEVSGTKKNEGYIIVALSDKDTFQNGMITGKEIKVGNQTMIRTTFGNLLSDKEYAVSVFQDENSNRKMDTKIFGIPKEKYGFSNNPSTKFSAPAFEDCKFMIEGDTTITIKLK